jgi:hypothetical protein
MKSEDEQDGEVAELFDAVADQTPQSKAKRLISDQAQIEQLEREEEAERMREACGRFLSAEREHQRLSARHDVVSNSKVNCLWWDSLERVYELEKVVWKLFVGNQPSPEQNKLFAKFREMLVQGSRLKANA